jgi:hypothetical protein
MCDASIHENRIDGPWIMIAAVGFDHIDTAERA